MAQPCTTGHIGQPTQEFPEMCAHAKAQPLSTCSGQCKLSGQRRHCVGSRRPPAGRVAMLPASATDWRPCRGQRVPNPSVSRAAH
eukprot:6322781-Prymnesium_polylepis.1